MAKKRIFKDDDNNIEVCPYAYYVCTGGGCPIKDAIATNPSSLAHWKDSVKKADSCDKLGEKLSTIQYQNKKIGKLV